MEQGKWQSATAARWIRGLLRLRSDKQSFDGLEEKLRLTLDIAPLMLELDYKVSLLTIIATGWAPVPVADYNPTNERWLTLAIVGVSGALGSGDFKINAVGFAGGVFTGYAVGAFPLTEAGGVALPIPVHSPVLRPAVYVGELTVPGDLCYLYHTFWRVKE